MQLLCGYGGLVMHVFYNFLCDKVTQMVLRNIKLYNMADRGGDGLVMTQNCANCDYFTSLMRKNDSLNAMCY